MAGRYELETFEFEAIADLLPPKGLKGGRWNDHHKTLNGMFWILNSGAKWRDLPGKYGKWQSVYDRFNRWSKDGTLQKILRRLHLKLNDQGLIDADVWHADSTTIRASRAASGAKKKYRRW